MGSSPDHHDYVEFMGGPLDGKQFIEIKGTEKYSHRSSQLYEVDGHLYHPFKVEKVNGKCVLKMKHKGKSRYKQ